MKKKNKITKIELNEKSWERKKLKKKKGLTRGNRANPNPKKAETLPSSPEAPVKKENRAIPLFIPGRATPLVAEGLEIKNPQEEKKTRAKSSEGEQALDLVINNGKILTAKEIEKAHRKANQIKTKVSSVKNKESNPLPGNKKLGKAALRLLEREEVALGEEEDFFTKANKIIHQEEVAQPAEREEKRIKSRDYKAGRNTDYVATQAAAEKAISPKKKKVRKTGEDLLSEWENLKW